jgi:hypothetical protein
MITLMQSETKVKTSSLGTGGEYVKTLVAFSASNEYLNIVSSCINHAFRDLGVLGHSTATYRTS